MHSLPSNTVLVSAQISGKCPILELDSRLAAGHKAGVPSYRANRAYQPDTQFAFLVDRLIPMNLYSAPTEMEKLTSNCEYDAVE